MSDVITDINVKKTISFKGNSCHKTCQFLMHTSQGKSKFWLASCLYFGNEQLGEVYLDDLPERCDRCRDMLFDNVIEETA